MATISVDVYLENFDLDEILEELEDRYDSNKKEINDFIKKMKIDCEEYSVSKNKTLLDEMKIDFLIKNLDRIKLQDLENII